MYFYAYETPSWVIIANGYYTHTQYANQSRMERLHQSQIIAYRKAAVKSIQDWTLSVPLGPMEEGDTKQAFVERCVPTITTTGTGANTLPNWHLATAKATAIAEIRKRAIETYEKYHPTEEAVAEEGNADEAGNADNGTGNEDGEVTGDDASDEDGEAKTTKQAATAKYVHPNRNKKGNGQKNATAHKKGTKAKGGRGFRGGRDARQGGRGRGNGR
mmetsp:Transcript_9115/g.19732  ORF Transcript_9115/g.19732 Transcript_9115/m.19732 type:complete len:216 (+) Transcript_9115:1170-1817(+)